MTLQQRKEPFVQFGLFLKDFLSKNTELEYNTRENEFAQILQKARHYNGWFDDANLTLALKGLIKLTDSNDLNSFCNQIKEPKNPKTVAVIMAGNIPAVGFHDFLCVLLSGHNILIKTSSDDAVLMPWIINFISDTEPAFKSRIKFSEGKLEKFDALIATGSNNSAQYFEQYFNKIPRIIRKNRNSVALLNGLENMEDLQNLGKDIFTYYGLGCRNVSKLLVPEQYDFKSFFEAIFPFGGVINNKKYGNNYDYNRAVMLMNLEKFQDNNFLLLKESQALKTPVAVLHYEYYPGQEEAEKSLIDKQDEIQCIVSNLQLKNLKTIPFGITQIPDLGDFADNVNTLVFLSQL